MSHEDFMLPDQVKMSPQTHTGALQAVYARAGRQLRVFM